MILGICSKDMALRLRQISLMDIFSSGPINEEKEKEMTAGVLLLNASFEPLRVVSLFRAVCMVVEDKAEIIKGVEGKLIRSQYISLPHPSVVRLKRYVKVPFKARPAINTKSVLSRDQHVCAYCKGLADTIDHIYPRARGGKHEWMNVIAACGHCNAKKADNLLEEIGMKLLFKPTLPPSKYWFIIGFKEREQWEEFIPASIY